MQCIKMICNIQTIFGTRSIDAFPCNALQASEIAVLKVKQDKRELGIMHKANVSIQEFTATDKTLAALRKRKDSRDCELHALKGKQHETKKKVR